MSLNARLDYEFLIKKYPWITTENQKTIISPDVDGILCGLFMSHYYNWEVVGYYDGKQLAIKQNVHPESCIFLDMEIYRKNIKSCGHHMVLYNKKDIPPSWNNFSNCINPNILRSHDANHNFQEKYPLAMIHFLLCLVSYQKNIIIQPNAISPLLYAISPLLYVDGTFKNLLNYPENCISWLKFLGVKDPKSSIYPIFVHFANRKIAKIIHDLETIFEKFREITDGKRGGDKIKITEIVKNTFSTNTITRVDKLIDLLSTLTGFVYKQDKWIFSGFRVLNFTKKIEENLNKKKYLKIIEQNPLSWAITATKRMEYTLEVPDKFK